MRRTPDGDRQPQLVDALVVAVHDARRGGHPGGEHDVQLAAAGDVEQQPLVVHDAGDGSTEERLGGVDHPTCAERGDGIATPGTHVIDVVHEQRRPEPSGQRRAASSRRRTTTPSDPTVAESGSNRNSIGAMSKRI